MTNAIPTVCNLTNLAHRLYAIRTKFSTRTKYSSVGVYLYNSYTTAATKSDFNNYYEKGLLICYIIQSLRRGLNKLNDRSGASLVCACTVHALGTFLKLTLLQKMTHARWTHFTAVLPSVFFLSASFHLLVYEGHRGRCHGRSAIPPSGAPAASSTIVAMSGLACARAHGRSGRPSLSGVIDSTSSTSVAKSFSQDDLLALVWDKFAWLMQLQANPPLSVQLAPPGQCGRGM